MALTEHVAIVSLSKDKNASFGAVAKVSAAIQKQVTRDFGPIWGIAATVDAFEQLSDVPIGYWVVMIIDQDQRLPPSAGGVHLDQQGQPFALVRAGDGWEMTASHEVLEMLADPFGNRLVAGDSPAEGQGRVEFLVEVCDPSEATDFGYTVNGILLSDFYTPQFFDPVAASSVRYSFTGAITAPRTVLPGGYLSWRDPVSNEWFQWQFFSSSEIVPIGSFSFKGGSLRATIERETNEKSRVVMVKHTQNLTAARKMGDEADKASEAKARDLMEEVNSLYEGSPIDGPKGGLRLKEKNLAPAKPAEQEPARPKRPTNR